MNTTSYGDVPMGTYMQMVGRRPKWRYLPLIILPVACVLAFAAGKLAPWSGRGTKDMSLEDAIVLARKNPILHWEREIAQVTISKHTAVAMETMGTIALNVDQGKANEYAVLALRKTAVRAIQALQAVEAAGVTTEMVAGELQRIRGVLDKAPPPQGK